MIYQHGMHLFGKRTYCGIWVQETGHWNSSIITWIEAFTIFSMILCQTFPSRQKDLNQYKLLIIQTARRFSDKSWLHYDIAFRKEAAASGLTDWSCMHPDLYNFHTRSPAATPAAPGSSTSPALSLTEPLASSGNPQSSQYCHSWNDGRCHWPFGRCRFCHSCETCHGDHPRIHCPHHSARRERSNSPSQSKGGHRRR